MSIKHIRFEQEAKVRLWWALSYLVSNSIKLWSTGTAWSSFGFWGLGASDTTGSGLWLTISPFSDSSLDSTIGSGFGCVNVNGSSTDRSLKKLQAFMFYR